MKIIKTILYDNKYNGKLEGELEEVEGVEMQERELEDKFNNNSNNKMKLITEIIITIILIPGNKKTSIIIIIKMRIGILEDMEILMIINKLTIIVPKIILIIIKDLNFHTTNHNSQEMEIIIIMVIINSIREEEDMEMKIMIKNLLNMAKTSIIQIIKEAKETDLIIIIIIIKSKQYFFICKNILQKKLFI